MENKDLTTTEPRELVQLSTMTKDQVKMWLGDIARRLIYDEGYYIKEAAEMMAADPELREAFALAGYMSEKGVVEYSSSVLQRWAARAYKIALNGDKRSVSTMLFTKQLVELLEVQQLLLQEIRKGKFQHVDRFTGLVNMIARMMPGHLVGDTSNTMNFTKIVLSDGEKREMLEIHEEAVSQVQQFEGKLIEGEIIDQ